MQISSFRRRHYDTRSQSEILDEEPCAFCTLHTFRFKCADKIVFDNQGVSEAPARFRSGRNQKRMSESELMQLPSRPTENRRGEPGPDRV